tara:strand:- start:58 stop:576 length:519 start_codon:yes stop_codon:yes gene_type:complete
MDLINQKPLNIEFKKDCAKILSQTILAVSPEEGCAILLGKRKKGDRKFNCDTWQIELIWPCCNTWDSRKFSFMEYQNNGGNSFQLISDKHNRFAIDPREQILAQKWARLKNLELLGFAHSHTKTEAVPSELDISWASSTPLMVILDRNGCIFPWWVNNNRSFERIEIVLSKN